MVGTNSNIPQANSPRPWVPQISVLSNEPALAGGEGKEHPVIMDAVILDVPMQAASRPAISLVLLLKPVFEHGSVTCVGVRGDGGGLRAAS
jgi:hypothetical protein